MKKEDIETIATVIFCSNSKKYFQSIVNYLEYKNFPFKIITTNNADNALCAVPENEKCILLTEALIPGKIPVKRGTDRVLNLAKNAKSKNINCFLILYTVAPGLIEKDEVHLFDEIFDIKSKDSCSIVKQKFLEFSQQAILLK
ncbi:MAG: hypothetical protein NTW62_03055 [Candidatus Nomurabacteria bacterium]|nr:hypothetical protein [Candidatus Nomurabacteria bacterium]